MPCFPGTSVLLAEAEATLMEHYWFLEKNSSFLYVLFLDCHYCSTQSCIDLISSHKVGIRTWFHLIMHILFRQSFLANAQEKLHLELT